jgi:hypothetical protein
MSDNKGCDNESLEGQKLAIRESIRVLLYLWLS